MRRIPIAIVRLSAAMLWLALVAPLQAAPHGECVAYALPVPLTADEVASRTAATRYLAGLARTSDLRLRIALSRIEPNVVRCADGTIWNTPDPALASLVDLTRGSTDPMILAAMVEHCGVVGPDGARLCAARDFAERWAAVDQQNVAAWLTLAVVQKRAGDAAASARSAQRASTAPTWRDDGDERMRVIERSVDRDAMLPSSRRLAILRRAFGSFPAALTTAQLLRDLCRAPETRESCAKILSTMERDANELMTLSIVASTSALAGASDAVGAARRRRYEAMRWSLRNLVSAWSDSDDADRALASFERRIALGEVALARDALREAHITEDDAAARESAWLAEFQHEMRERERSDDVSTKPKPM